MKYSWIIAFLAVLMAQPALACTSVLNSCGAIGGGGGGSGDVSGPGSSTDDAIATWDGTGGDTLQNTGVTIVGDVVTANAFIPTSSTATGNRFYLPAADTIGFSIGGSGELQLTNTALSPISNDGLALGVANTNMWADLFLANGGVINFNNGSVTITNTGTNALAMNGINLSNGGGGSFQNSDLFTGSARHTSNFTGIVGTSSSSTNTASILFAGASNVNVRSSINGITATGISANNSYATLVIGTSGATEAASGTHALIASQVIKPVTITAGAGAVTNTASLYIEDAPSASGATNYALWVDAGNIRWDGQVFATAMAQDTATTNETVCRDTTTGQLYRGTGASGICLGSSSKRFKHDIRPVTEGLDQITALQPVNFFYNKDRGIDREQYGFIAEDVVKVIPKLVGLDKQGKPNSVDYMGIVPVLVKAVQELKADNDNLKEEIKALKQVK
jgi:hypothetical protein